MHLEKFYYICCGKIVFLASSFSFSVSILLYFQDRIATVDGMAYEVVVINIE